MPFTFVVPFSVYVGITQQAFVQSEVADKQIGAHDGFFQYSAGESRTGGFSFEIDSEVCNVEHITDVDFLQIQTYVSSGCGETMPLIRKCRSLWLK